MSTRKPLPRTKTPKNPQTKHSFCHVTMIDKPAKGDMREWIRSRRNKKNYMLGRWNSVEVHQSPIMLGLTVESSKARCNNH
jgi:hypothetical protein